VPDVTCHQLQDALLDHARGVLVAAGSRAAIESHLEHCRTCAAEYARQRALTVELRAVAESSAHQAAPRALEQRVLDALVARQAQSTEVVSTRRAAAPGWLAAAASLAVLAGGIYGIVSSRGPAEVRLKPDATPEVRLKPDATPEVRLKPDTTSEVRLTASAEATASPPERSARRRKPDATPRPKPDTPRPKTNVSRPSRPAISAISMDEFVALPGASGLPAFESGRIVRVDLSVSSLPAYGVELVPDAARSEVQADVLVGQDGQARAIRLVSAAGESAGEKPPARRQ
jgi:hypothetical protein